MIDRSVVVHRGVRGLRKGSGRGRGIGGGCSRNRGSRFKEVEDRGFYTGLYSRL